MKKLILILLAAVAFSCGDGSNRSSQGNDNADDGMQNTESAEPADTTGGINGGTQSDTTNMQSDTTRNNQQ